MANNFLAFWSDLRLALAAAWPEVPQNTNFRAVQMRKVNWVNLVEAFDRNAASPLPQANGLQPPYVVVHVPPVEESDNWGLNNLAYTPMVAIYYICRDNSQPTGFPTLCAYLEDRLEALRAQLLKPTTPFVALQVLEEFILDVSETNAVNASMLEANMPFTSGALSFEACFGEIIGTP